jgi:outer membrane murein-binding lipoprotein Lpp
MKKSVFLVPVILALLALPLSVFADEHLAAAPKAAPKEVGQAQPGPHHGGDHAGHQHGAGHGEASGPSQPHHEKMMEKCKEMMAKHDQMEAEMKAMDARLDEKVAAMNDAKADQKIEAMAAVITEFASQRKEMREKMGQMHHGKMCMMMCPMMGQGGGPMAIRGRHHGGMGGMKGMDCPMMKQHGDTQPQSGGEAPQKKGESS